MKITMKKLGEVLWPRGLAFRDGELHALGRGRPRGAGGPDPNIEDRAGYLQLVSNAGNVTVAHPPTDPPFRLWKKTTPNRADADTDRPYAGLVWHAPTKNFFLCCFSGIDKPSEEHSFRKNASDAVLRFDTRVGRWFEVERHDPDIIDAKNMRILRAKICLTSMDNRWFPNAAQAPRGLLNGPDGLLAHEDGLYVVAKDNHALVRYDLRPLFEKPDNGPLEGTVLRANTKAVEIGGQATQVFDGPSSLATDGKVLYVGMRSTGVVLRFPLGGPFDKGHLTATIPKELQLIDMTTGPSGDLYVSSKKSLIWRIPDPRQQTQFQATPANAYAEVPGNLSNVAVDANERLHVCSNDGTGAIYREEPAVQA